jgi:hypothetical protein
MTERKINFGIEGGGGASHFHLLDSSGNGLNQQLDRVSVPQGSNSNNVTPLGDIAPALYLEHANRTRGFEPFTNSNWIAKLSDADMKIHRQLNISRLITVAIDLSVVIRQRKEEVIHPHFERFTSVLLNEFNLLQETVAESSQPQQVAVQSAPQPVEQQVVEYQAPQQEPQGEKPTFAQRLRSAPTVQTHFAVVPSVIRPQNQPVLVPPGLNAKLVIVNNEIPETLLPFNTEVKTIYKVCPFYEADMKNLSKLKKRKVKVRGQETERPIYSCFFSRYSSNGIIADKTGKIEERCPFHHVCLTTRNGEECTSRNCKNWNVFSHVNTEEERVADMLDFIRLLSEDQKRSHARCLEALCPHITVITGRCHTIEEYNELVSLGYKLDYHKNNPYVVRRVKNPAMEFPSLVLTSTSENEASSSSDNGSEKKPIELGQWKISLVTPNASIGELGVVYPCGETKAPILVKRQPNKSKTSMCLYAMLNRYGCGRPCKYGKSCAFVHKREEFKELTVISRINILMLNSLVGPLLPQLIYDAVTTCVFKHKSVIIELLMGSDKGYTEDELVESLSTAPSNFGTLVRVWSKARMLEKKIRNRNLALPLPSELVDLDIADFDEFATFYVRRIYTGKDSICEGERTVLLAKLMNQSARNTNPISVDPLDRVDLRNVIDKDTEICTYLTNCIHGCHFSAAVPRTTICGDCLSGNECSHEVQESLPILTKILKLKRSFDDNGFEGNKALTKDELESYAIKYLLAKAELVHKVKPLVERQPPAPEPVPEPIMPEEMVGKATKCIETLGMLLKQIEGVVINGSTLEASACVFERKTLFNKCANAVNAATNIINSADEFKSSSILLELCEMSRRISNSRNNIVRKLNACEKMSSKRSDLATVSQLFELFSKDRFLAVKEMRICKKILSLYNTSIIPSSWSFIEAFCTEDVEFYEILQFAKFRYVEECKHKADVVNGILSRHEEQVSALHAKTSKPKNAEEKACDEIPELPEFVMCDLFNDIWNCESEDNLLEKMASKANVFKEMYNKSLDDATFDVVKGYHKANVKSANALELRKATLNSGGQMDAFFDKSEEQDPVEDQVTDVVAVKGKGSVAGKSKGSNVVADGKSKTSVVADGKSKTSVVAGSAKAPKKDEKRKKFVRIELDCDSRSIGV